jgi:hypothetical protein
LATVIAYYNQKTMGSALESRTPRLIEYPADLSGCNFLSYGGRQLLYLCSHEGGNLPFVVVLGFFSGQKEDVITKDLIEPVGQEIKHEISMVVSRLVSAEYQTAHIFFI